MKDPIKQWEKEEKEPFSGWDFAHIKDRYKSEESPWEYNLTAKKLIKNSNSVLDMATGGGEVYSKILSEFIPKKARQ